jgi:phage tail-like protein
MEPVKRSNAATIRYPYPAYNFHLYIDEVCGDRWSPAAAFSEVTGLQVEIKPIEYRDGADEPYLRKIRGMGSTPNVVCKRGISGQTEFWKWLIKGLNGDVARKSGGIVMLNEDREDVMTWTFENAWPTKYVGPSFNAKNNEIAFETIELAVEMVRIDLG